MYKFEEYSDAEVKIEWNLAPIPLRLHDVQLNPLQPEAHLNNILNTMSTSQKKHRFAITKTKRLTMIGK
jgi:hypothetical protein